MSPRAATRPGASPPAAAPAGAGDRRRRMYGASAPEPTASSVAPAGSCRGGPQERTRSGRPASSAPIVPAVRSCSGWSPSVPDRSPHPPSTAPARGTFTVGTPAPCSSAIPTARRWRTWPGVPGGNAAATISSRNVRPRAGAGSGTLPSAAHPQRTGATAVPAQPDDRRPAHALGGRREPQRPDGGHARRGPLEPRGLTRDPGARSTAAACRRRRSTPAIPAGPGSAASR